MSRILVCKDDENLYLKKSRAFQYKDIDLTSITCGGAFSLEDNGEKLVGVSDNSASDEEPIYTIVTNEFGLYEKSGGVKAKVKVSFCDNGMMVVDVLEGAVLIKPDEEVLLASRGVSELPSVNLDKILWVNADRLLSYAEYWGNLEMRHVQDFEFVFVLSGENNGGLTSFGIKEISDETVDISGGHIAVLERQIQLKEEAKQAKKGFNELVKEFSSSGYEFDDEDDEDEDDEDEDFYDDDEY